MTADISRPRLYTEAYYIPAFVTGVFRYPSAYRVDLLLSHNAIAGFDFSLYSSKLGLSTSAHSSLSD